MTLEDRNMKSNTLRKKVELMDESAVKRAMMRLSYEIVEKKTDLKNLILVGIETRGVPLARMLKENLKKITDTDVELGSLNIKYYRDDLEKVAELPELRKVDLPFSIDGREVVLVDDVIYTGRTVRAAIEALFDAGRPAKVRLAVLVDRGHRELPIRPDYVGKNVPTSQSEVIAVNIEEIDGFTGVEILEKA